jgi:hypothetical protein
MEAESLSPQPNGVLHVLLVVNQLRSESEDDTQTRAHTGRADRVAQDQEPPARTLISTSAFQQATAFQAFPCQRVSFFRFGPCPVAPDESLPAAVGSYAPGEVPGRLAEMLKNEGEA